MHSSAIILAIAAGALAAPVNKRQIGAVENDPLTNGAELGDDGIVSNLLAIPENVVGGNTKGRTPNAIAAPPVEEFFPKRQINGLGGAGAASNVVTEIVAVPEGVLGSAEGSNKVSTGLPGLGKRQDADGLTSVVGELLGGTWDGAKNAKRDHDDEHPEREGVVPGVIVTVLGTDQYYDDYSREDDDDDVFRRQVVDDNQGLVEDVIDVLENKNPVGPQTIDRNTGLPARQVVDDNQGLVEDVIDVLENKNPVGPQTIDRNTGLAARQIIPGKQGIAESLIAFLDKNKDAQADRPVVTESLPTGRVHSRQVGQLAGQAPAHHNDFVQNIAESILESPEESTHDAVTDRLPNGILKRQLQFVKDQGIANDIENILLHSNQPADGTTGPSSIAGAAGNTGAARPAFPSKRQLSEIPGTQQFTDYASGEGAADLVLGVVKDVTAVDADLPGTNVPAVNNNGKTVPIAQSTGNFIRQVGGTFLAPLTNILKPFQTAAQNKIPAVPGAPVQGVPTLVN